MRYPSKFFLTLCSSWLIICLLPIIILWWRYIIENRIEPTQINSTLLVTLGTILGGIIYTKVTKHPGQQIIAVMLPILTFITLLVAMILLIFRFPYSVYQLTLSFIFSIAYIFFLQLMNPYPNRPKISYISLGRGRQFQNLYQVNLSQIISPDTNQKLEMIVADLSSEALDEQWQRFLAEQAVRGIPVYNYLQIYESLTGRSPIKYLYENNLGALQPSLGYLVFKRVLDIFIILISAPIVIPILLVTTIAIKLDSHGKAIFVQQRVGQGGKIFEMYKFRSMYVDSPKQNQLMTQTNDSRITKVGRFIRKWRIDELPQFYNVLKGDMSLIGPRPELPSEVAKLEKQIPFYIYRQIVKPGISGWAQVMQGEGHVENIQTKLEYDFYYIKNFSFALDFLIVIKTIQTMVSGFGAR